MALDYYHSDVRCTRYMPSSCSCVFKATISPYNGIVHITRKDSLYTQIQFVSCYHNKKCPHTLPQWGCHYSFKNTRDNKHRLVPHREKQIILCNFANILGTTENLWVNTAHWFSHILWRCTMETECYSSVTHHAILKISPSTSHVKEKQRIFRGMRPNYITLEITLLIAAIRSHKNVERCALRLDGWT